MSSSRKLWAVSGRGNVYMLSVNRQQWQQVANQNVALQGFKKVSASASSVWGLGCDHQVYVYVPSSDLPIRCQEVTYENERWIPSRGWSGSNLLPVDPWHWSSEDGTRHLPKDEFKLPSCNWQWESDWYVDENVHGHLTDKGGWRYATMDFHHAFSHQKKLKSCVRRRRWIRYRRYVATNRWARVSSIHVDPLEEPVVDIAVGGQEMAYLSPGHLTVCVVTINGKLWQRGGVDRLRPEGERWVAVECGEECESELLSVSVGNLGLMWAITWSGNALARMGASQHHVMGTSWCEVPAPEADDRLLQVTVGNNAVWASTASGKVWFRKGVKSAEAVDNEDAATGTGWVSMVNRMRSLTMGPNDQVWGIDYDDRQIFYRTGVTLDEQTGRSWVHIDLPYVGVEGTNGRRSRHSSARSDVSGTSSNITLSSAPSYKSITSVGTKSDSSTKSDTTMRSNYSFPEGGTVAVTTGEYTEGGTLKGHKSTTDIRDSQTDNYENGGTLKFHKSTADIPVKTSSSDDIDGDTLKAKKSSKDSSKCQNIDPVWTSSDVDTDYESSVALSLDRPKSCGEFSTPRKPSQGSTESVHSQTEASPASARRSAMITSISSSDFKVSFRTYTECVEVDLSPDKGEDGEIIRSESGGIVSHQYDDEDEEEDDDDGELWDDSMLEDADVHWVWVSPMACNISGQTDIKRWIMPHSGKSSSKPLVRYEYELVAGSWRYDCLKLLRDRNLHQWQPFHKYSLAIDRTCWTKKGTLRWWQDLHRGSKWLDCQVELTQESQPAANNNHGSFTLQYTHHDNQKHIQLELGDIVCICCISDWNQPQPLMAIHTKSRLLATPRLLPYKIAAHTEEELEDWLAALSVACCDERGIHGRPHRSAAWATTDRGDIFVHDPDTKHLMENASDMLWRQFGGHLEKVEANVSCVVWGIGYDGTPWVYTGSYGGGFFKGMATSPQGIHAQTDTRNVYIYENQRWRPVIGYSDRVLLSDRPAWSDESGRQECSKENIKLPSKHCSWVSEWQVDLATPGGVDKSGWQFAKDFRGSFKGRPRLRSYVRRRRWVKQFRVTTSGPWTEVMPLKLEDISLQVDPPGGEATPMAVWAIGTNGDVLCRTGVIPDNPAGEAWVHVPTDQSFVSVSVGGDLKVWAVARDGSAWLRAGISHHSLTGECWYQVPPPPRGSHLKQISAGMSQVWAVDTANTLWYRSGMGPRCPEGDSWTQVCSHVRQVSVGPKDKVWAVVDGVQCRGGLVHGVLACRINIPHDNPHLGQWDYGSGGGWHYVSGRTWLKSHREDVD